VEEYADAIISQHNTELSSLSKAAKATERGELVLGAKSTEVGWDLHFWWSRKHIMRSQPLVPPGILPYLRKPVEGTPLPEYEF
jgi:hypothetical protein